MLLSLHQNRFLKAPISDKTFVFILSTTIFLFNAAIGLQGLDMYDEGWSLTGYQQIFNNPESIEYMFLYYLANVVGGVWNIFFGWGGIYAFRILTAIFITLTAIVVWNLLRDYFNRWAILLGLIMACFSSYYGIMVFYHNYLTAFLTTCAIYSLFRGLTKDRTQWVFFCGFIIGCNIFARIPNISLLGLGLLFIPYYIYNKNGKKTLQLIGCAIAGLIIGILFILCLMFVLGHLSIFVSAVSGGFSAASDTESTHNLSVMLANYMDTYKTIFTVGFFNNMYSIYLFGTLMSLWIMISRRYPVEYVYLACLSLLNLHLLPLGSDFGVSNMGENCLYVASPFLAGCIDREIKSLHISPSIHRIFFITAYFFAFLFIVRGAKNMMTLCYFDQGSRIEKIYLPESSLATTFTTKENCQALNTILNALSRYVKPDDELLCFQNMPCLHYLTQTRPYLGNPWVWTYDPNNMERHFKALQEAKHKLPVIVREKTMIPYWTEPYPDWNNPHAENNYFHKNKKILLIQRFIQEHHYQVVWENNLCQILLPT